MSRSRPTAAIRRRRSTKLVTTLFDLGRQVTSVLDLDELLQQIPRLIGRLIPFEAFAVYLLDERRGELQSGLRRRLSGLGSAGEAAARPRASSAPRSRASSRSS